MRANEIQHARKLGLAISKDDRAVSGTIYIANKIRELGSDIGGTGVHHLTTQAQRPGTRDETIATATLPPGRLKWPLPRLQGRV